MKNYILDAIKNAVVAIEITANAWNIKGKIFSHKQGEENKWRQQR